MCVCVSPVCEEGPGAAVWAFLCVVVCEDLCQPDDLALSLQEQKALLGPALAVLSALYACQGQHFKADISKCVCVCGYEL